VFAMTPAAIALHNLEMTGIASNPKITDAAPTETTLVDVGGVLNSKGISIQHLQKICQRLC
jgi:hypothetical protein